MNDIEKLTAYLRDFAAVEKMAANYPPDSKIGRAVAECLTAFAEHGRLLDPFFGRVSHDSDPAPVQAKKRRGPATLTPVQAASNGSMRSAIGKAAALQLADALGEDHYEIIAGERRFRASKLAGAKSIPATIRDYWGKSWGSTNAKKLTLFEMHSSKKEKRIRTPRWVWSAEWRC